MHTKISALLSGLFGNSAPQSLRASCGMTGHQKDLPFQDIDDIKAIHRVNPLTGIRVDSPTIAKLKGGLICIGSTGAMEGGFAGHTLTDDEYDVAALDRVLSRGCKIIGPDGKEIKFD